ncbi:MAG: hypothetical protein EOP48_20670, partial [Sphingobacteriales bacterium]
EKIWEKEKQKIKGADEFISKYNQFLHSLKTKAWEVYHGSIKNHSAITPQQIKDYILGNDSSTYTLREAINYHIGNLKARVGHDVAPATVKNYETCKRKVEEFLHVQKGLDDIFLHQLNHQFIQELDVFMRVKRGLHNNGVVKNMQQLKGVIRAALRNEWMQKDPFSQYQSKIIEPKRVHLTKEELSRLERIPLPTERLARVRNVFVFSCYTGLAYSDVAKLNGLHIQEIDGREWIILDQQRQRTNLLSLYCLKQSKYCKYIKMSQRVSCYLSFPLRM